MTYLVIILSTLFFQYAFLIIFLGIDRLTASLPALSKLLTHESPVVAGYAAHAIEKILMTRDPKTKQPLVDSKRVAPVQDDLLLQLGKIVHTTENDLAARALSRLLALQKVRYNYITHRAFEKGYGYVPVIYLLYRNWYCRSCLS